MAQCEYLIKQNVDYNCEDPIVKGLEKVGWIFNRADVDFGATVFDTTNKNIIKTLALKEGKKGYSIYQAGKTPFTGTKSTLAAADIVNTFTHDVQFVVMDDGADVTANIIDPLANGEFVVILENKYKALKKSPSGNAAFEVFGYYIGLTATTVEQDKYSDDTLGGWSVILEETTSPFSALYLFDTDFLKTKAAIESLVAE